MAQSVPRANDAAANPARLAQEMAALPKAREVKVQSFGPPRPWGPPDGFPLINPNSMTIDGVTPPSANEVTPVLQSRFFGLGICICSPSPHCSVRYAATVRIVSSI